MAKKTFLDFEKILADAQQLWERTIPAALAWEALMDRYDGLNPDCSGTGRLVQGDNLCTAKLLLAAGEAGTEIAPRLVYMDPPFYTKMQYSSTLKIPACDGGDAVSVHIGNFRDRWSRGALPASLDPGVGFAPDGAPANGGFEAYLTELCARILAARDLLADDGCLWLHLDHHAVHYVKVLCDVVFGGGDHLVNEVVWQYKSGGAAQRRFARKHDTLLFYAKDPKRHFFCPVLEKSYNRKGLPYRFKGVKEYRDEEGWYTLVNMRDVWQIDMVGRTSGERTGYATQKPEALLERIVSSCSEKEDLCVDLYGGSGTMAAVCARLGRRWFSVDKGAFATLCAERRLARQGASFEILRQRWHFADAVDVVDAADAADAANAADAECAADADPVASTEPDVAIPAPNVRLRATIREIEGTDGFLLTVRAEGWSAPSACIPVPDAQIQAVLDAAERSPGALIAGLAAGLQEDGDDDTTDILAPLSAAYGSDRLEFLAPKLAACTAINLTVRAVDVFGNSVIQPVTATRKERALK
ncbi:MAG: site-specific DNA-methyltransferase [Clostridiales Family XIII bacterium]|jgi:hypothetical protein|nr:site-specific DNA-methyltransferase [Clostridiales Family XIII bacterium]